MTSIGFKAPTRMIGSGGNGEVADSQKLCPGCKKTRPNCTCGK